jgi:penicillin-binding protein 2
LGRLTAKPQADIILHPSFGIFAMRPDRYFDWRQLTVGESSPLAVVDPRRRMRLLGGAFVLLLVVVFARLVRLERTDGAEFRAEAARPLTRIKHLPGVRGRILARDGTVLAYDKKVQALAVHYRYLQQPPNPRWLRNMARARLPRGERRNPQRLAAAEQEVKAECAAVAERVAKLCGVSSEEWNARARQAQARVERIAESVNRRREQGAAAKAQEDEEDDAAGSEGFWQQITTTVRDLLRSSMEQPPPARITVAEELDAHVMVEDVPLAVVAEIEAHASLYPGVRIVQHQRRAYPSGSLAAHVLGHLGAPEKEELTTVGPDGRFHPDDRFGRLGLERQYERLLHGQRGVIVEETDRSGRVLNAHRQIEPGVGRDLVLTIDSRLQASAETLLASALERRTLGQTKLEPAGGAIVVMNIETGALLAAASAPAFDPNLFAVDGRSGVAALLGDAAHPLFDRVARMAIPAGSVFKVVTAAALLKSAGLDPEEPFTCQGYLHSPDAWRCAIYQRHGIGHGEIRLVEAIAESCNVYFFHYAGRMGPEPLVSWAMRFGFGQATGIDLPQESAGTLPTPRTMHELEGHPWGTADTQSLAIGQSALLATPLQVVRMIAAVGNGGRLVTPHVVSSLGLPQLDDESPTTDLAAIADSAVPIAPPRPIAELDAATLATLGEGLKRVVNDPHGTGYGTVRVERLEIAGKTGTAQCGDGRAEHAWFAGYVPADNPRWAFVVALEHAGNADTAAGPVARRLVLRMQQLGLL